MHRIKPRYEIYRCIYIEEIYAWNQIRARHVLVKSIFTDFEIETDTFLPELKVFTDFGCKCVPLLNT